MNSCGCEAPKAINPLSWHHQCVICCACHAVLERAPIGDEDQEPESFAEFVETCLACDLPAPDHPLCRAHRYDALVVE